MNLLTLLDELAAAEAAVMGAPWRGYRSDFAQRTALQPPMVVLRNVRVQYHFTHGFHLLTLDAAFIASGTNVEDPDAAVFSVLSTEADGGKAEAIASVVSATGQWTELGVETGSINDQLLIGQQTYRAAVVPLELLCPDAATP